MDKIDEFRGEHGFLSNFHPSPVVFDGVMYPTVENAYQAAKTEDKELRKPFRTMTAGQAKRAGRQLKVRDGWYGMSLGIMEDLLYQKFNKYQDLQEKLIETGVIKLIEGNNWGDTFWGQVDGKGENHLGRLLMKVRADLIFEKVVE